MGIDTRPMTETELKSLEDMLKDPEVTEVVRHISKVMKIKPLKTSVIAYCIGFQHGISAAQQYIEEKSLLEEATNQHLQ